MQSPLLTSHDAGIVTFTLNYPEKCNALNEILVSEMIQQLQAVDKNPAARVVILQGNGKDFCAGADLNWLMGPANDHAAQLLAKLFNTLYQLTKPTIILLQGNVYGGGLGLVACCDIAIASKTANFCFSEVKLGLIPAIIAPYCIAAMGRRAAQYYFLTAQSFNADEAQRLGLIRQIVQQQDLQASGQALAKTLLANSPQAMRAAKGLLNDCCCLLHPESSVDKTIERLIIQQRTADAQEGFKAFKEKRKPNWNGS